MIETYFWYFSITLTPLSPHYTIMDESSNHICDETTVLSGEKAVVLQAHASGESSGWKFNNFTC